MSKKILILMVVSAVFSVGCAQKVAEKAVERAIEKETGGKAKVNTQEGTMELETKEGKVQIGTNKLPEGFPDDIPVYKDAKITSSLKAEDGYSLTMNTEGDELQVIADYYKSELEKEGWKSVMAANSGLTGQAHVSLQYEKGARQITITITGDGKGTAVSMHTSENK